MGMHWGMPISRALAVAACNTISAPPPAVPGDLQRAEWPGNGADPAGDGDRCGLLPGAGAAGVAGPAPWAFAAGGQGGDPQRGDHHAPQAQRGYCAGRELQGQGEPRRLASGPARGDHMEA